LTRWVVAPDTGILLAIGYGEAIDPKAREASIVIEELIQANVRLALVQTVASELEAKLSDIGRVYGALKAAFERFEGKTGPLQLLELEEAFVSAKQLVPRLIWRYVDALEVQAVQLLRSYPAADAQGIIARMLLIAVHLEEGVRERIASLHLSPFEFQFDPAGTLLLGEGHEDSPHLQACQALALSLDSPVIFLVLESRLHARRGQIRNLFPRVHVTNPLYVHSTLERDEPPRS